MPSSTESIISTLASTPSTATPTPVTSYVPTEYQNGFSAAVGSLNIFCGILGTLLAFLKYAEIYEGHRISALAWSKLSRNIEIELSLHDLKRKPCRDYLKVCRAEYDNLLESSPNIDLDVIHLFNKKFKDEYPDVRKPIIVNGLKSIEPYKAHIIKKPAREQEPAPERHPVFEPEQEPEPEPDVP